jgi:hypothetical protein
MANWSETRVPRKHNENMTGSSTNGAGKTWYPHAKKWNWTLILHHTQKSIQNCLKI